MDQYNYLYHHGILGQKWGVRRFQNKNGTLTSAGRKRYGFVSPTDNEDSPLIARIKKDALYQNSSKNNEVDRKKRGINGSGKSRKQLNKEKKEIFDKEFEKSKQELTAERNKIFEYGEKHHLDLDDGGGGDDSDPKAGIIYMNMWDKYSEKEERLTREAEKRTADSFISKYGQETVNKLDERNKQVGAAKVTAMLSVTVASIALRSHYKNKKWIDNIMGR